MTGLLCSIIVMLLEDASKYALNAASDTSRESPQSQLCDSYSRLTESYSRVASLVQDDSGLECAVSCIGLCVVSCRRIFVEGSWEGRVNIVVAYNSAAIRS